MLLSSDMVVDEGRFKTNESPFYVKMVRFVTFAIIVILSLSYKIILPVIQSKIISNQKISLDKLLIITYQN